MKTRLIYQAGIYRIMELQDEFYEMDDLKGDSYNPKVNNDIDPEKLKAEEKAFEKQVYENGVYGYVLEFWNPEIGIGWEHVDSCYGFVGQYDPKEEKFNHYIIEEMKGMIERK